MDSAVNSLNPSSAQLSDNKENTTSKENPTSKDNTSNDTKTPKKQQQQQQQPVIPTASGNNATPTPSSSSTTTKPVKKPTNKSNDNHEVLSDAVAASGVNIRAEEEAMANSSLSLSISKKHIEQNNFLKHEQLSWFIHNILDKQGIKPLNIDNDVTNLISSSCENYMSQIIADIIIMMRHRRHLSDIVNNNNNNNNNNKSKNKKSSKNSKNSIQNLSSINNKSEISKALRDLASKHKEREEKRIRRRIFLGLEEEKPVEEIVQDHNQTNLTANLMMSGSKQKKYSWMQSSSNNNSNSNFNSLGDNGIRYREAREEPSVVMRDLIAALENRRMGVSEVLLKAYARLKD